MLKSLEGARLGIFVFLGTVLIVVAILLIGNQDSLFQNTITVKTYFEKVEGLKTGSPVRLSGYDIGSVSDISLSNDTSGNVLVKLRIEKNVQHFIRLNSVATIETEGLVGKKVVSITPGSTKYEVIKDGGIIEAKNPVNIQEIIAESQGAIANLRKMSENFAEITTKVNEGQGTVGKIFNDDELYYSAVDLTKSADRSLDAITNRMEEVSNYIVDLGKGLNEIMHNVDSAVVDIKQVAAKVNGGKGALGALIADESLYDSVKTIINDAMKTAEFAKLGAAKFSENMEALKHNWLFKSYFEERGYWDRIEYEHEIKTKLNKLKEQEADLDKKIEKLQELQKQIQEMRK